MNRTFVIRSLAILKSAVQVIGNLPVDSAHPLEVVIRAYKAKRSSEANRYYWRMLHEVAEQAWIAGKQYSADAIHEYCKRQFLGTVELPGGGVVGISTATLNTAEFAAYTEQVEAWAASELGVMFSADVG